MPRLLLLLSLILLLFACTSDRDKDLALEVRLDELEEALFERLNYLEDLASESRLGEQGDITALEARIGELEHRLEISTRTLQWGICALWLDLNPDLEIIDLDPDEDSCENLEPLTTGDH